MLTSDWSDLNIFRRVALLMAAKKSNLDFLSKSEFVSIENDTSRGETKTWSQQEVCRHLFFLFLSHFFFQFEVDFTFHVWVCKSQERICWNFVETQTKDEKDEISKAWAKSYPPDALSIFVDTNPLF